MNRNNMLVFMMCLVSPLAFAAPMINSDGLQQNGVKKVEITIDLARDVGSMPISSYIPTNLKAEQPMPSALAGKNTFVFDVVDPSVGASVDMVFGNTRSPYEVTVTSFPGMNFSTFCGTSNLYGNKSSGINPCTSSYYNGVLNLYTAIRPNLVDASAQH